MTYPEKVMFDTWATTSFISKEFINAYSLKCKPLDRPISKEFQDVFPQELPGMPPDREIEFTIDLTPGTSPIAQGPYKWSRMS
jgi:hypothetical protein